MHLEELINMGEALKEHLLQCLNTVPWKESVKKKPIGYMMHSNQWKTVNTPKLNP